MTKEERESLIIDFQNAIGFGSQNIAYWKSQIERYQVELDNLKMNIDLKEEKSDSNGIDKPQKSVSKNAKAYTHRDDLKKANK